MKIPLATFEQVIDKTILKRGFAYFNNGAVSDFTEISKDEYEAIVSGTEDYTVQLNIKNNTIVSYNCDCPYDFGPVCKHLVATIFYLQQDILGLNRKSLPKPRAKRTKSIASQMKELLKTIPHDELMLFIEEKSKSDRKFRASFLATYGHLCQEQSKEFYQKQIRGILNAAKGRDGWIAWNNLKYVVNTTQPFLTNAEKYIQNNNFENAFYISTALLEEFTEAFQFADDSNGDLGYFIECTMELLSKLTTVKLPLSLRDEFFDYCISTFKKGLFSGWDWHMKMLYLASQLVINENEADTILNSLDTVQGKYDIEQAQTFKLELLRKFKGEKETNKYIENYISNPSIRTEEIIKAINNNDFERAIKLSKDGVEYDKKEKPGLVKDWYNWLLEIAQAQKDTSKIIVYARYLLIDNFYPKHDYYQILKSTIKTEDWHPFLEELILDITPKKGWTYTELLRKIYIEEKWWDRLFVMLKQNVSLGNIEQNEKYLSQDYNSKLIDLYTERISNYVDNNVGRSHYQTACRYLRRMKNLGGQERVNALTTHLREKYPQRRALQDELDKV